MNSLPKLLTIVCSCLFLQGCILLLPVIEENRAADRLESKSKKSCPFTDSVNGRNAGQNYSSQFDHISEAQAFVAAHQPRSSRRVAKLSQPDRLGILVGQLRTGTEVARTHAATDIGMMGKSARSAVPSLSNSIRYDDSKWVRRAAVKSLAKISGQDVVAPLTFALKDSNRWVVHSAENALRKVKRDLKNYPSAPLLKPAVYRAN